jgi:hypothetical protein
MSRSVSTPVMLPLSATTTVPMSRSRMARAASLIVAPADSVTGSGVITSRICCFLPSCCFLAMAGPSSLRAASAPARVASSLARAPRRAQPAARPLTAGRVGVGLPPVRGAAAQAPGRMSDSICMPSDRVLSEV